MNNNMMLCFSDLLLHHIPYMKYIMNDGLLATNMWFPKVSETSKVGPLAPINIHNISCYLNKHTTNQYIAFKRLK